MSSDGAFRDRYWATYRERPSDTLKRARAPKQSPPPAADDHVVCLECGRKLRRLRRHLAAAHGLTPDTYRQRWGLRRDYPLVCAELSRQIAAPVPTIWPARVRGRASPGRTPMRSHAASGLTAMSWVSAALTSSISGGAAGHRASGGIPGTI
jgi:ROS/MUCR transcriptional regulator protein